MMWEVGSTEMEVKLQVADLERTTKPIGGSY
jgi:hypothetical protein